MNGRTPPESACNRIPAARPAVTLDGTKIHIADIASRTAGKEINMAKDTHVTAPTRFIEANGIRYATGASARKAERRLSSFNTSAAALTTGIRL